MSTFFYYKTLVTFNIFHVIVILFLSSVTVETRSRNAEKKPGVIEAVSATNATGANDAILVTDTTDATLHHNYFRDRRRRPRGLPIGGRFGGRAGWHSSSGGANWWICNGRWWYGTRPVACLPNQPTVYPSVRPAAYPSQSGHSRAYHPRHLQRHLQRPCRLHFQHHPMTWSAAAAFCSRQGMRLAKINSRDDQVHVTSAFGDEPSFWIGASDRSYREGYWTWTDGTLLTETNWAYRQPDGGIHQNCLQVNFGGAGRWDDADCAHAKPFLCQRC